MKFGLEFIVRWPVSAVSAFLNVGLRGVCVHVARAGAVSQLVNPVEHRVGIFVFFVRALLKVARVAPGAIGGKPGGDPRGGGRICPVAIGAIISAVARREQPRAVGIPHLRPAAGAMAIITLARGHKMAIRLAGGGATIVAGRATAGDFVMIKPNRAPIGCYMAGITGVG